MMKVNPRPCDPIIVNGVNGVNGEAIEEEQDSTYLSSNISRDGGADRDVELRIAKARQAFRMLRPIWLSSQLSTNTKIRIFDTNVKSVLLYGSETWKTTKSLQSKLQVFVNKCLRYILKIWWPNKITNEVLWRKTNREDITRTTRRRKWNWIGHTLRKDSATNITRQALDYNPQGQRKRGRPKNKWRRTTLKALRQSASSGRKQKLWPRKE